MLRPSFVPPLPIRRLRDLTRYRVDLVAARTAEKNRVEKLLEDACIKLSVVASDIFGVSGRAMMAALIAGERDPKVLDQLARKRMRTKIAPGVNESAGKKKGKNATGHGNRYLARVLGNAAASAGRTDTFLGERYRRIARRRGSKKAVVAVGRSILVNIWHLLADPSTHYTELGSDFYDTRVNPERRKRNHIRQLEALGYKVTLQPTAA